MKFKTFLITLEAVACVLTLAIYFSLFFFISGLEGQTFYGTVIFSLMIMLIPFLLIGFSIKTSFFSFILGILAFVISAFLGFFILFTTDRMVLGLVCLALSLFIFFFTREEIKGISEEYSVSKKFIYSLISVKSLVVIGVLMLVFLFK